MKKAFLPFVAVLLLLAFGCSEEKAIAPNQTTPTPESSALNVQAIMEENTTADWSQPEASPQFQVQADSVDTSFDVYAVAFIWGRCANKWDSVAVPTDWSGSLSMNAVGSMRVRHVFRFEPGQDSLLPRIDSTSVSWVSQTTRNIDGLGVFLLVKRGVVYVAEPTLSFQTAPFSINIPISGLERYNAFYRLDDHNGVVAFARKMPRRHCPSGPIFGIWHRDSTSQNGPFEGFWLHSGMPGPPMPPFPPNLPKVHGKFFTTDDGKHLFAGKYTDSTGTEIGEVFGHWFYDDPTMCPMCGSGHAQFKGRFTINGKGEVGDVHGQLGFGPGPTPNKMDMPMRGMWRFDCQKSNESETISQTD